jgi:hypothetical protein
MQAELDELLLLYRTMNEDQQKQLIESAKALLEEQLQASD